MHQPGYDWWISKYFRSVLTDQVSASGAVIHGTQRVGGVPRKRNVEILSLKEGSIEARLTKTRVLHYSPHLPLRKPILTQRLVLQWITNTLPVSSEGAKKDPGRSLPHTVRVPPGPPAWHNPWDRLVQHQGRCLRGRGLLNLLLKTETSRVLSFSFLGSWECYLEANEQTYCRQEGFFPETE